MKRSDNKIRDLEKEGELSYLFSHKNLTNRGGESVDIYIFYTDVHGNVHAQDRHYGDTGMLLALAHRGISPND